MNEFLQYGILGISVFALGATFLKKKKEDKELYRQEIKETRELYKCELEKDELFKQYKESITKEL